MDFFLKKTFKMNQKKKRRAYNGIGIIHTCSLKNCNSYKCYQFVNFHEVPTLYLQTLYSSVEGNRDFTGRGFHYAINRQTTTTTATTSTLLSWGRTLTSAFGSALCWILVFIASISMRVRDDSSFVDIWGSAAPDLVAVRANSSSAC